MLDRAIGILASSCGTRFHIMEHPGPEDPDAAMQPTATAGTQAVDRAAALLDLGRARRRAASRFTELSEDDRAGQVDHLAAAGRARAHRAARARRRRRVRRRPAVRAVRRPPRPVAELVRLARPVLERLGEQTGETVQPRRRPRRSTWCRSRQVDSTYLLLGARDWIEVEVPAALLRAGQGVLRLRRARRCPPGRLERRTDAHRRRPASELRRELATDPPHRGYATTIDELETGSERVAAPVARHATA